MCTHHERPTTITQYNTTPTNNHTQLCRRAFDSLEQLRKHEAKSKLHAENLAKAQASGGGGAYRDRASERRQIYGQVGRPWGRMGETWCGSCEVVGR